VPATVQAVLAARIDRLPPEGKRLLQTAAVIGMEVSLPLLQTLAELPEEEVQRGLAHLQAAEFLYETRLFPEREFTFKHALTHEVAYNSLLQERRRVLHAQIVTALEALAGDRREEQGDLLAQHAVRGQVWAKALTYCRQAGEKAMARSAYREAVGSFEQALSVLPHLPEQRDTIEQAIDLRLALRNALLPSGNLGRILALLREAEALAAALDDSRRLGQISARLSRHFYFSGAYDQAIAAGQRALALAMTGGDVVRHALVTQTLGTVYYIQGHYHRAIACFEQTIAYLDGAQGHERFGELILPAVFSRAWMTVCHAELGTFTEGRAIGEAGLRIAEAIDHHASLMLASWGIGLLVLRQGDLSRALPLLERAVGLCQAADMTSPAWFPWITAPLGAAYTLARRVADAVPLLTLALEQTMATETAGLQARCCLSLGEAHMLAGHLEEAHAIAERALALVCTYQERGHQAYALWLLGEIAAHRTPPDIDQAAAHYHQALTLADALGMRPLQAHCHRGLGTLYLQADRLEQARAALSTAIEMYQSMEMTFWLPETEATLAQVERR
jgi:tetratricopeptide (TPR) repeat protein